MGLRVRSISIHMGYVGVMAAPDISFCPPVTKHTGFEFQPGRMFLIEVVHIMQVSIHRPSRNGFRIETPIIVTLHFSPKSPSPRSDLGPLPAVTGS